LALGLILAGLTLARLSRRLRSHGLSLRLTRASPLSATALRDTAAALSGSPATALPATGGKSPGRSAATTGEAAASLTRSASATRSASTPPPLRIHLANEPQNENARNESRPDTTP
jgi:hypothetical protein